MAMEKSCVGFRIEGRVYCVKDAAEYPAERSPKDFACLYTEDEDKVCSVCKKTLKEVEE